MESEQFDYDLTVIGATSGGIEAATKAASLQARVALVTQGAEREQLDWVRYQGFLQGVQTIAPLFDPNLIHPNLTVHSPSPEPVLSWADRLAHIQRLGTLWQECNSLEKIALLGVDWIEGKGEFQAGSPSLNPKKQLCEFVVGDRTLRSRTYLLALDAIPAVPPIPGLDQVPYLTSETLLQHPWHELPQRVLLLVETPQGLELAQALARLGSQVTVVVATQQLLPGEEIAAIAYLQAHLEAEGIQILSQTQIRQVKAIEAEIWLQGDRTAYSTDALVIASRYQGRLQGLNLPAIGLSDSSPLIVDAYLRTVHPRIYACGAALGGYAFPHLARYEARVAVHNALFWRRRSVNYTPIAYGISTDPPLVRVGLTEAQARQPDGEGRPKLGVLQGNFLGGCPGGSLDYLHLQLADRTIPWGKIILGANGEIMGAHFVGRGAMEWGSVIALALQNKITISALSRYPNLPASFAQELTSWLDQWQQQRLLQTSWKADALRWFFNWRRTGNV